MVKLGKRIKMLYLCIAEKGNRIFKSKHKNENSNGNYKIVNNGLVLEDCIFCKEWAVESDCNNCILWPYSRKKFEKNNK